jgi:D-galactonate transporter
MTDVSNVALVEVPQSPTSARTFSKVAWRVVPLLMFCYFLAYLDRVNVGFAKLQMLDELKLSELAYGLGAGLFFIGYFIFEVPSNILMMRIGAKKTISRIMILWGIISMAFAFVSTPLQFYVLRILLGAAEAGFFPGIILYLTFWFPSARRSKMTGLFYSAIPVSGLLGGPVSGWIMSDLHLSHGWSGWQWLFVLEGIPSVLMGLAIPFLLTDTPAKANWLSAEEKGLISAEIDAEARITAAQKDGRMSIGQAFGSGWVWYLVVVCILQAIGVYGLSFWLPTMLKEIGYTTPLQIGLVSTIPFGVAIIALNVISRSSDRHRERRWHAAFAFALGAAGLLASIQLSHSSVLALLALTVATAGIYSMSTMFWTLPSLFFGGIGMATAIGIINSLGGLGGFLSPYLVGYIKDTTGTTTIGMYVIATALVVGALMVLRLPRAVVNR